MLIPSHRHKPADLALWAELEGADRARSDTIAFASLMERSRTAIRRFLSEPAYASVSWGKDSVVLAWLVRQASPSTPLVHLRAIPAGNPDCLRVRDEFLGRFPGPYEEIEVDYREVPAGLSPDALEKEGDRRFYAAFRRFGDRYLSGIRADESHGRKIRMRRWGLESANTLAPLGWWSGADTFACLAAFDLPVHPSYAMLGGGRWPRKHIRVDELAGDRGGQFGRREWELEYYGDALRRIEYTTR